MYIYMCVCVCVIFRETLSFHDIRIFQGPVSSSAETTLVKVSMKLVFIINFMLNGLLATRTHFLYISSII